MTRYSKYAGPERRNFIRVPFEAVIRCKARDVLEKADKEKKIRGFVDAVSKDISASGLLLKSEEKFTPDTVLELEFSIPNEQGYAEVKILGKVVRAVKLPDGKFYDNGISFYKIKKKDEALISSFVDFLFDTN